MDLGHVTLCLRAVAFSQLPNFHEPKKSAFGQFTFLSDWNRPGAVKLAGKALRVLCSLQL